METYRELCIKALECNEEARNSDWVFLFECLNFSGVYISQNLRKEILDADIAINTVLRERRHIQNKLGLYTPTDPEVIARRKAKEQEFKENYKKYNEDKNNPKGEIL